MGGVFARFRWLVRFGFVTGLLESGVCVEGFSLTIVEFSQEILIRE